MRLRVHFAFFLWCFVSGLVANENRIWLDAKINGKPVRLIFDTGASHSVLFSAAARDLGIRVFPAPDSPAEGFNVLLARTEPFLITTMNFTGQTTFGAYDLEKVGVKTQGHGLYSWTHMKTNIFVIDGSALAVKLLDRVPNDTAGWTKLAMTAAETLSLEVPGEIWTIALDTGSPGGVSLRPQQWREWKAAHPNAAVTLDASYIPSGGSTVREEAFARELSIGSLRLSDVPIRQPTSKEVAAAEVTFGLAALARLDFIVDGKHGFAYLRPKRTPPEPYQHNRMGAVFAPPHSQSDQVVAHVLEGGPAHLAGLRNGDILLKINDSVVTKGRADSLGLYEFWERPAGIKLDITVKRGDQTLKIPVVLRDILGP